MDLYILCLCSFCNFNPCGFASDLLSRLERLRGSEKTVGEVGPTLINWVSITLEEKPKLIFLSSLIHFYRLSALTVSICSWS